MRLLVINPNTSESVSAQLQSHVAAACGEHTEVRVRTARFGAPYIASESSYAVAEHATLDAWSAAGTTAWQADAVLVGCFGDPGLFALRECSAVPVTGLAIASLARAARDGRFAIVTGGHEWKPILTRFAHATGHADRLACIETVQLSGAELAARPDESLALLREACLRVTREHDVGSVIIGGAALAGMADALQPFVRVPLIDSVVEGAHEAMRLASLRTTLPEPRSRFEWTGLSPEMQAMVSRRVQADLSTA
ncbi:aspartate/glutamate racemase family protein [soil metagenome]